METSLETKAIKAIIAAHNAAYTSNQWSASIEDGSLIVTGHAVYGLAAAIQLTMCAVGVYTSGKDEITIF